MPESRVLRSTAAGPAPNTSRAYSALEHPLLNRYSLNLQAVFELETLPEPLQRVLAEIDTTGFRQLLLIGNGGAGFWRSSRSFEPVTGNPLDEFAQEGVRQFLNDAAPAARYRVLYPGAAAVPLQALGQLAGWHHPSPFMVGINDTWGSWFAYRVLLLADTDFPVSAPVASIAPCVTCADRPCAQACPAQAVQPDAAFQLERCLDYRLSEGSVCADTCQARLACPVALEHRYPDEQIRYHYRHSLDHIIRWRMSRDQHDSD